MAVDRLWFSWHRPPLPQAAEELWKLGQQASAHSIGPDHSGDKPTAARIVCDLSDFVVVVPGKRGGNRLLDLLVEIAGRQIGGWLPPQLTTVGTLPELFYTPKRPFASALVQQFAWARVLLDQPADKLSSLIGKSVDPSRHLFWLELGDHLAKLSRELASENLSCQDVLDVADKLPDFPERERWQLLGELQAEYLKYLDRQDVNLWDRQTARRVAIERGRQEIQTDKTIVLVGTVDLNRAMRLMLDQVETRVISMIFADDHLTDDFDAHGCLQFEAWRRKEIGLRDEQILIADSANDQARGIVGLLSHWSEKSDEDAADGQVTLAIADQSLVTTVQRQLRLAGQPSRWLGGESLRHSLPYLLLEMLAKYLERRRFADFAALVRHPDIKRYAERQGVTPRYLQRLDHFQREHLPLVIESPAPPSEQHAKAKKKTGKSSSRQRQFEFAEEGRQLLGEDSELDNLLRVVEGALGELRSQEPGEVANCGPVREFLMKLYSGFEVRRDDPAHRATADALETMAQVMDELETIPPPIGLRLQHVERLRIILRVLSSQSSVAAAGKGELDLVGWLDAPWEDSDATIVAGFNDGSVPSSTSAELFLPEQLRTRLGMEDSERRYARDAYALSLLLAVIPEVRLVLGRRDVENNPLIPSRLLFAVEQSRLGKRAKMLFDAPDALPGLDEHSHSSTKTDSQSSYHQFRVPRPRKLAEPIVEMPVTRFRDYLFCPYRYYLNHVLKLREANDQADEIQGDGFGILMHDILEWFGRGPQAQSTDRAEIEANLMELLNRAVSRRFATETLPAVAVQIEQLRRRLVGFADAQAGWAAKGWRIWKTELSTLRTELSLHGQTFTISGRIDRIDHHPQSGAFAILDYKSSDSPKTPELSHRDKDGWTNLQLPLYRHLAGELAEVSGEIQLGFFALPRDVEQTGIQIAPWGEKDLLEADHVAAAVIEAIREEKFWPPREPDERNLRPIDVLLQGGTFDRNPVDIGVERCELEVPKQIDQEPWDQSKNQAFAPKGQGGRS